MHPTQICAPIANVRIPGRATSSATELFAQRHPGGQYRTGWDGLHLSSVGMGTYLGETTSNDDDLYEAAAVRAVELGVNVLDTASNYRCQRSERAIGHALQHITQTGIADREDIVVASKAGFVPFESVRPTDAKAFFEEAYVSRGLFGWDELVADCHCLAPKFLNAMIDASRKNLQLETIDLYYLHNPETQLTEVTPPVFEQRMRAAFEVMEQAVDDGTIGAYGLATWGGFRQPAQAPDYLSLEQLVGLAEQVGGDSHHFRAIQLPVNLSMLEAHEIANQQSGQEAKPLLEVAQSLGVYVMASASLLQGRLSSNELGGEDFSFLETPAQRALHYVRSLPGVGTALVGMKRLSHVNENVVVLKTSPM